MTKTLLLAGCYASDGITLLSFDDTDGTLAVVRTLPGAPDVSFMALDAANRRLYVTDEGSQSARLGAFAIAPGLASLSPLGYKPSGAIYPCYVALSPDRKQVAVANYGTDLASVFAIEANGALGTSPQVLRGTGTEAEGHAHWIQWSPEGDRIYVTDLGHDEIRVHAWDRATGAIGAPVTAFRTPAGHGPRHLAFHPNGRTACLITEHGNTLVALERLGDGTLREINTVPSIPEDYTAKAQAAHIQISPDGKLVYVSNRGPNTIGVFRIAGDGSVSVEQQVPTGGDWPRFFLLLGRHLLACNQQSDSIVVFDVAHDGTLAPNGQTLALRAPVMLLPVDA